MRRCGQVISVQEGKDLQIPMSGVLCIAFNREPAPIPISARFDPTMPALALLWLPLLLCMYSHNASSFPRSLFVTKVFY